MTDLSTAAQTALRAIKLIRQYDLATSAEAETLVLQKLSAQDMTTVVLALSESESPLSPVERVNHILDRLVNSYAPVLQFLTERCVNWRKANPDNTLSVDPDRIRREFELRYRDRTRDFVRALVHAGLSDNVIAGLWPVLEQSRERPLDTDSLTRNIRRLGGTMMLTSNHVDRFELSDARAVLAHIEATFDDLEIVDINTLPKDTYRLNFESREAVLHYLRTCGVLDVPEIDICLTAVQGGFIIDLTALEVTPTPLPTPDPNAAKEIAIACIKRWKWGDRTEEEDEKLTEDQLTKKLEQSLRSGTVGPETQKKFEMLIEVAQSLLQSVPADVVRRRWLERVTDYAANDEPTTFEQVLQAGEELKTVLDYWNILKQKD